MFCLYIYFDKLLVIVFYFFMDSYSLVVVFNEVFFYSYMYYGFILLVYWFKILLIDLKGIKMLLILGIVFCFYGKLFLVYSFIWLLNEMMYNMWWILYLRGLIFENLLIVLLMNYLNFIRKNFYWMFLFMLYFIIMI